MPTCTAACTRCRRKRRRSTKARARKTRSFVNAASTREIVFVRGTTEAINLVAQSYARPRLGAGDEIVVTRLEHHSNIVPWQLLAAQTGAAIRVVPIDRRGVVDFDAYLGLLGPRTRVVALAHVSNALGTVLPLADFIAAARERGIATVVDGAQAVPHLRGRRPGARLRLLCVLRAQDVRPDRHRRALCARTRACRHATLAGRRRHDPVRVLRRLDLEPPAVPLRGRHAEHRRRGRARRRDRLPRPHRRRPDRRARTGPARLRHAAARRRRRTHAGRHGAREIEPRVFRGRGHPSARPRHRARFARRRRAHGPSLRDAGDGVLRPAGDDARLVRALQHARRRSTCSSTPSATRSGCCADGPRRALPRRHCRPQPEPA